LTVLFASVGMVVTFFTVCGMGPGVSNPTLDDRITDDKFCIAFDVTNAEADEVNRLTDFFAKSGASEVNSKSI
jgi:putative heme degradation protein